MTLGSSSFSFIPKYLPYRLNISTTDSIISVLTDSAPLSSFLFTCLPAPFLQTHPQKRMMHINTLVLTYVYFFILGAENVMRSDTEHWQYYDLAC